MRTILAVAVLALSMGSGPFAAEASSGGFNPKWTGKGKTRVLASVQRRAPQRVRSNPWRRMPDWVCNAFAGKPSGAPYCLTRASR
ncbi:MAG: hypothetical protein ACREC6_09175 [Hyphomicrobiaceae bacterium]